MTKLTLERISESDLHVVAGGGFHLGRAIKKGLKSALKHGIIVSVPY